MLIPPVPVAIADHHPQPAGRWLFSVACLLLFLMPGCGGKSDLNLVPVQGKVTYEGKPVPGLSITFLPNQGRPSWALTDDSGNYEATYTTDKKGVQAGSCKIWVAFKPQNAEQGMAIMKGEDPFAEWAELLEKYGNEETTPLQFTVSEKQPQLDLKLD